jgi:TolB-like protein
MGDGVNIAARLEGIAKPGAICLVEQAYWQVKGRLDLAVIDLGPTQLKNIADSVRVYSLEPGAPAQAKPTPTPPEKAAARLSIVVLPFANLGGDSEQDHFVDGVTESLTTDLSRIRGAVVIGRNTAFTYKGKAVDLKQIGRELNVRYVLEGSVQRGGSRMRVNVQFIDAESGHHLWAERFDKPLADLFDMQEEIVARLANALNIHLVAGEARRAEQSPDPDSMDLYFQGLAWLNKSLIPGNLAQARSFLDRALSADPDNIEALVGSARTDFLAASLSFSPDPTTAFAAAEEKLTRALSAVPNHQRAHSVLGFINVYAKRAARSIAECEYALGLDRNLPQALATIGWCKIFIGRGEETEGHVGAALRLSPRDNLINIWMNYVGVANSVIGCYEQAVAWHQRSIEANRNFPPAYLWLAAALGQLGRLDEARSATQAALALNPRPSLLLALARFGLRWRRGGSALAC